MAKATNRKSGRTSRARVARPLPSVRDPLFNVSAFCEHELPVIKKTENNKNNGVHIF